MKTIKYKLRDIDRLMPSQPHKELPAQAIAFILHKDISISFHFANSVYWDLCQKIYDEHQI